MTHLRRLLRDHRTVLVFALVGGLNTLVDLGVFTLLTELTAVPSALCQGAGYMAGMVNSYFFNKYVTFRSSARSLRQTVLFFAFTGLTLLLGMGLMWLLHDRLGLNKYAVKFLLVTPGVMALNYFGYKRVVFRDKPGR